MDFKYCKDENVYYTPKGKLSRKQLELLMQIEERKQKSFFEEVYSKFQDFKDKVLAIFK